MNPPETPQNSWQGWRYAALGGLLLIFSVLVMTHAGWLIAVIVVAWMLDHAVRHNRHQSQIQALRNVISAFSQNDFAKRAAPFGNDELAHLGRDINVLGGHLTTAHAEFSAQRQLLDSTLGALTEGVACIDPMDCVVYANAAWPRLVGFGASIVGHAFYEQIPAAPLVGAVTTVRTSNGHADVGFDHGGRQLQASVIAVHATMLVIVLRDVTELVRLEGARREFVASVSHELKTPLTAISGFTETLLDGALESDAATARDFVEKIARHADRLTVLIRDVLTLSRLEQGALAIHPEPIDLVAEVRSIADEHQAAALERQVVIRVAADAAVGLTSDRELVHQLVGNLVSNAVRYNRTGGTVTIRLSLAGEHAHIVISDTGIGIPAEHQVRIFERFYRVDAHRSRQSGGTGLGLAIVKHLVHALNGTIALVSGPDGTTFTVELPLVHAPA